MSSLVVLLLALVWMGAAIGAGRTLLSLFRVRLVGSLEPLLLSLALGFALISYAVLGLGSAGLLSAGMAWSVFAAAVLLGLPTWRAAKPADWAASVWPLGRRLPDGVRGHWITLSLLALIVVAAMLNLVAALAPPTAWDALSYHLAAPAFFIRDGGISFVPMRAWASPFTAEMWNVIGLLVGTDRLPLVFQWAMGVGSAAALYLLAVTRTSRRTALLAAAIFYTSPHAILLASSAKSDLAWMVFLFLSLHTLLAWRERGDTGWLALSGLATGLAVATKFQGLFWVPGMLLLLAVLYKSAWRSAPLVTAARVSAYGGIAALVASPWWIRSWVGGGDPIWPYGYPIFKSLYWTQEAHDKYASWTQGPGDSLWHLVTLPWNITLNQSAWPFGLQIPITPLLLAFVPAIVLLWRRFPAGHRWFFLAAAIPVAVHYVGWFVTYQQPRYLFPAVGILMIPAAYAFWQLVTTRLTRWPASGLLLATLTAFLAYNLAFTIQFVPVVVGTESTDDFLARKVSFYDDILWANGNLPVEARILFFHNKSFYLERDFLDGSQSSVSVDANTTAHEYLVLLIDNGITHLFLPGNVQADSGFTRRMALLAELKAEGYLQTVYSNPSAVLIKSRTLARSEKVPLEVLELHRQPARATRG